MEKEYYIQGDPARANEIKAAFEKLGINVLDFGFADKAVVYCSIGECVQYLPYSINLMNILYSHPAYMELPLPVKPNPKFKIGDWLWHKTKGIFPLMVEDYDEKEGYLMLMQYPASKCYFGRDIIENEYRLWEFSDAKEGDVLVVNGNSKEYKWIGIFKAHTSDTSFSSHCHYNCGMCEFVTHIARCRHGIKYNDIRPATNEERVILFAKMREAGYEWDKKKKELRKIIKPKFNVGDKIEATIYGINRRVTIRGVDKTNRCYLGTLAECIGFSEQDQWHLAPKPHYDISNFYAGMPVLVRADNNCRWDYSVFSRITGNEDWQFAVCNGVSFTQCIPFEGNETLLGTTDMCDEQYINW